jgi:hypothetical protein
MKTLALIVGLSAMGCMATAVGLPEDPQPVEAAPDTGTTPAEDTAETSTDTAPVEDSAPIEDTPPPPSTCTGTKIDAPKDAWAWVPYPDAKCGRGTSTGIGIHDAASCAGGKAANLDGYDKTKLASELSMFSAGSVFDRSSDTNPFRDYSLVFVPYCTGDFHTGDRVSEYGIHHVGFSNLKKYLANIVPTFCDAERVVLTGSSAGGFGSTFNYAQVKEAFGKTRVDLIDDSGPYLRPPYMSAAWQAKLRSAWGFVGNLPKGCTGCETEWHNLYPFLAKTYPDARLSLVMAKMDYSIGTYFGMDPYGEARGVDDLADNVLAPLSNFRVYLLNSNQHVWLSQNLGGVFSGGSTLSAFLTKQVSDDASWSNVRP